MSGFRWTLDHLERAERAFERHRADVASGKYPLDCLMPEPACDKGCAACDLCCAVIVAGIETTKRGLAEQARAGDPAWELRHAGRAFAQTVGRA